jgi:cobyrinic acid a,c-diamide synthase
MASGAAFTFSYAETTELLVAAGADVVPFDPLHDEHLPAGSQGLVLGGGFPELHATPLADNRRLLGEIAALAATGAPIAAECAGLLYLARSLDGAPMAGIVPTDAAMSPRLSIGYREAVAVSDSSLCRAGLRVRGHEFHRTACAPRASGAAPAWAWQGSDGARVIEGFVEGGVHASYLHLHWAGVPGVAERLVTTAARTTSASLVGGST